MLLLHGLGATKASFLPTVAALAGSHRVTAIDLPGFGDSAMPLGAAYDAAFFARATVAALDALEIERAHVVGNSMGGRVALELGFEHPERVGRLALLAPSLAWLRERRWAPLLRAVRPELGLLQPAPRMIVDRIARAMVPGGREGWSAVGVDEFLRGYLTPRGRAAFYAAARNIYLEEPDTLLEPAARAAGRCAVRLGPAGPDRADRLRAARAGRAPGRGASRARLRPRAPARGAARDARRGRRVPGGRARAQPTVSATIPSRIAADAAKRIAPFPSASTVVPSTEPSRMLSSRAGATALTGARASANRIST